MLVISFVTPCLTLNLTAAGREATPNAASKEQGNLRASTRADQDRRECKVGGGQEGAAGNEARLEFRVFLVATLDDVLLWIAYFDTRLLMQCLDYAKEVF